MCETNNQTLQHASCCSQHCLLYGSLKYQWSNLLLLFTILQQVEQLSREGVAQVVGTADLMRQRLEELYNWAAVSLIRDACIFFFLYCGKSLKLLLSDRLSLLWTRSISPTAVHYHRLELRNSQILQSQMIMMFTWCSHESHMFTWESHNMTSLVPAGLGWVQGAAQRLSDHTQWWVRDPHPLTASLHPLLGTGWAHGPSPLDTQLGHPLLLRGALKGYCCTQRVRP